MSQKKKLSKSIDTLKHIDASRRNIPTAEYQPIMSDVDKATFQVSYQRRNRELDPQLVWRGKDEQDVADLVVSAPPLYIQEKIHPKVLVSDLIRQTKERRVREIPDQVDLFSDFNGLPDTAARTEFYRHNANWSNRMILGDSLQVMSSLTEREGLRGKVQCIYIDPPYGIKFNSNFQWSTTSRDVGDGRAEHITREPEQVKAFRDTWRDGIHSYLAYLRDRLYLARELLTESGSVFVQMGDANVHRVRILMDEVFGDGNFLSQISYKTSVGLASQHLDNTTHYLLWYCRDQERVKFRPLFRLTEPWKEGALRYRNVRLPNLSSRRVTSDEFAQREQLPEGSRLFIEQGFTSRSGSKSSQFPVVFKGKSYLPRSGGWRTSQKGIQRAIRADRALSSPSNILFRKYFDDFRALAIDNFWTDVSGGISSRADPKIYVVQTSSRIVERCILMATDPGDLVLDPTCGAGTSAYVSEQWGRRWITIDTSRVALALARSRIMGARYPSYLLADSKEGKKKQLELGHRTTSDNEPSHDIRQGFVYERIPHITLKTIANNAEIDVIWDKWQEVMEPHRVLLNELLKKDWEEWEIPHESDPSWAPEELAAHTAWWKARVARQKEIDRSIAQNSENELLYDRPYEDKTRVRVAGPFTVESSTPHSMMALDENDELFFVTNHQREGYDESRDFIQLILENLKTSGVQQSHKENRIFFSSLSPWPGRYICAQGHYSENSSEKTVIKRSGVFIGPEFGTVSRPDLVAAVREAADADFDVLIACAFSYDAHASDFQRLGNIPILKARMNADLHMAGELKNTGQGNLFVVFGEPDIHIEETTDDMIVVRINGVDVFHPNSGEVRSGGADDIACWFIDTNYNEESFFVRHAYFLGTNDPYKALKTTLRAEIDTKTWESLNTTTSRPFPRPKSNRIAVKVINHLGDEAMKVFLVKATASNSSSKSV